MPSADELQAFTTFTYEDGYDLENSGPAVYNTREEAHELVG